VLPVEIKKRKVLLGGHETALPAERLPEGPARLFFRPHDVQVGSDLQGGIAGIVSIMRRNAGSRRVELEIGQDRDQRVEIELPANYKLSISGKIAFLPKHYRIFPDNPADTATS
jgi:sulfate transport system ATP-binding protein